MADAVARKSDEGAAFWLLGGLYEVLVSSDESGGAVTIMRITVGPGAGSPPHTHPGDEVLYVLNGEIQVHIGDDVVAGRTGSSFFFPAGTREFFQAATETTVLISYVPGGVDRFFAEVGELALTRTLPPPSDTPPDFERIVRVAAQHGMNIEPPG
jgi:quercetin dioxygenase-like cupin family protein